MKPVIMSDVNPYALVACVLLIMLAPLNFFTLRSMAKQHTWAEAPGGSYFGIGIAGILCFIAPSGIDRPSYVILTTYFAVCLALPLIGMWFAFKHYGQCLPWFPQLELLQHVIGFGLIIAIVSQIGSYAAASHYAAVESANAASGLTIFVGVVGVLTACAAWQLYKKRPQPVHVP